MSCLRVKVQCSLVGRTGLARKAPGRANDPGAPPCRQAPDQGFARHHCTASLHGITARQRWTATVAITRDGVNVSGYCFLRWVDRGRSRNVSTRGSVTAGPTVIMTRGPVTATRQMVIMPSAPAQQGMPVALARVHCGRRFCTASMSSDSGTVLDLGPGGRLPRHEHAARGPRAALRVQPGQ